MLNRSVTLAFALAVVLIMLGTIAFAVYRSDDDAGERGRTGAAYEPVPVHLVEAWRA